MGKIFEKLKYINKNIENHVVEVVLTIVMLGVGYFAYYTFLVKPDRDFLVQIDNMKKKLNNLKKNINSKGNKKTDYKIIISDLKELNRISKESNISLKTIRLTSSDYKLEFESNYVKLKKYLFEIEAFANIEKLSIKRLEINKKNPLCSIKLNLNFKSPQNINNFDLNKTNIFEPSIIYKEKTLKWFYEVKNIMKVDDEIMATIEDIDKKISNNYKEGDSLDKYNIIYISNSRVELESNDTNDSTLYFIDYGKGGK